MANQEKINENFSLNYSSRNSESGDSVIDVSISFDNPKNDIIVVHRLNTWLQAIGRTELTVEYKNTTNNTKYTLEP